MGEPCFETKAYTNRLAPKILKTNSLIILCRGLQYQSAGDIFEDDRTKT